MPPAVFRLRPGMEASLLTLAGGVACSAPGEHEAAPHRWCWAAGKGGWCWAQQQCAEGRCVQPRRQHHSGRAGTGRTWAARCGDGCRAGRHTANKGNGKVKQNHAHRWWRRHLTMAYPTGRLNIRHAEELVKVLSDLKNEGHEVILVSSGAIGMGVGGSFRCLHAQGYRHQAGLRCRGSSAS